MLAMEAATATLIRSAANCCLSSMSRRGSPIRAGGYGSYNRGLHAGLCLTRTNLPDLKLNKVAEADFPSRFGRFRIYGFEGVRSTGTEEALALKAGDLSPELGAPLIRIHSQCLTGDVFHSLRCDCRSQLELALDQIVAERRGLLIYEHQEGRGI